MRGQAVLILCIVAVLGVVSAPIRAQSPNKAAEELTAALATVDCANLREVAKRYEAYERTLGTGKAPEKLMARVAMRFAICVPEVLNAAERDCGAVSTTRVGLLGDGNTSPREIVQAVHSLSGFSREVSRAATPEMQALLSKFKVMRASTLLEQQAFLMRRAYVSEADDKRYRELRQKPKTEWTEEERSLVLRVGAWDELL